MKRVEIGDHVYLVKEDIGTSGAIEWVGKYFPNASEDQATDAYKMSVREYILRNYADVPFLLEKLVYDEKGRKLKADQVPPPDAIRLCPALHESLHIDDLLEAVFEPMRRAAEERENLNTDDDGGSEKNLPTG